jgi:hypothetical protein
MKYINKTNVFFLLTFLFATCLPITASASGSAVILNVSPGTSINVGQTLYFNVRVTDVSSASYSVTDSNTGTTLKTSNINSSGNFGWTPKEEDIGGHSITVTVSGSNTDNITLKLDVNVGVPSASIQSLSPGDTVMPKQAVTFKVGTSNFTNPIFNLTDSVVSSSAAGIGTDGTFSWIPTLYDAGVHLMTVRVSDSLGNSAAVTQKITVVKSSLKVGTTTPGTTIEIGKPISFSVTPSGLVNPVYSISEPYFSGSSVSTTTINSSGLFNWTPKDFDRGSHFMKIMAIDDLGNTAETTVTINVVFPSTAGTVSPTQTQANTTQMTSPTKTISKYSFTKPLAVGASGTEVLELQKRLTALGVYSGPVTGTFGPMTRTAVKALQAKYGLEQIGSIGPGTRKILNN